MTTSLLYDSEVYFLKLLFKSSCFFMVRKGTPWVTLKYINVLQCTKQSFKFLVFHSISEDIRKEILCKSDTDDAGYHYTLLVENIEAYNVKSHSYTSDSCWWNTVWITRTSVRLGCHWASPAQYFFDRVYINWSWNFKPGENYSLVCPMVHEQQNAKVRKNWGWKMWKLINA